jgi:outer membrane protein OmpA-like peptidoglycan-associated protein
VIPHEEVNFRFDSAQIDDPEKPKLEASFGRITEALAKHAEIHVTLFIAGHTDTVGDAGYNLRLSRLRAQSISKWFRQRGLRIPIAFEGFGEYALLVKTADEVDEPRNRRVDYILSVDEPAFKTTGVRPAWHRVP